MLGAIIGDTVGSRFEWHNIHTKKFEFLADNCHPTDDSVMTIAVAEAILTWDKEGSKEKHDYERLKQLATESMRKWGNRYPYAGYGGMFRRWLHNSEMGPYNSCGNGAAMRVSPVGWAATSIEECVAMSKAVTEVTHNHPDGIMGAESTAVQIYLARQGKNLTELEEYEDSHYYPMEYGMDWLKDNYHWCSVCNGTCQAAFTCLYESNNFEDAIRNCMCIGGDCDTTGAICGGIAEAVYGIPDYITEKIMTYLYPDEIQVLMDFQDQFINV